MVEINLRSDFMLSTKCCFKCQPLGEGSHANYFLWRLCYKSGWTHTQLITHSPSTCIKQSKKAYENTIARRAHSQETARRTFYLKFNKNPKCHKSFCSSMQHTTPRRLNSNTVICTHLFKAGIWPFQAHLFQQTLLTLLMTAHIHKACKIRTSNNCW